MSLEIYKEPPELVFSGNAIFYGVKDTDLLGGNVEQPCILQTLFKNNPGSSYKLTITYNGSSYVYQAVNCTLFDPAPRILPIKSSGESMADWVARLASALLSFSDIFDLLIVQSKTENLYLIEREILSDIQVALSVYYATSPQSYYIGSQTLYHSSTINLGEPHSIGVIPMLEKTVSLAVPGGTITSVPEKYSEGVEKESDIFWTDISGFTKTSDGSMYKDINVQSLVQFEKRGHFNITLDDKYAIHDLAEQFSFYFYAAHGIPVVRDRFVVSNIVRVINATITKTRQAELNELGKTMWQQLLDTSMPLTWAPDNKVVDIYTPERLCVIAKAQWTDCEYYCKEYFDDDTDATHLVATFSAAKYQIIELSAAFLDVRSDSGKTVIKYELFAQLSAEEVVMPARTFIMDYTYQPYARWWFFKNGMGVYEVLRTIGPAEKMIDIDKVYIEQELPELYTTKDRVRKQISNTNQLSIAFSTGPLSKDWAKYYMELLDSEDVYNLQLGQAIPAEIEKGKYIFDKDGENIVGYTAEATINSDNEQVIDTSIVLPIDGDFVLGDFTEDFFVGNI